MEDFVHLHVHTYYSILDGQSSVQRLVDKAVANGMRGMALTDHGNMFGTKEFYNYCKKVNGKRKEEGLPEFKPIIGCEMYVARHRKTDKVKENGDMSGYHLIVLAKNYQGYKNLIKLVSRAWVDGYYMRPRTDREDVRPASRARYPAKFSKTTSPELVKPWNGIIVFLAKTTT